MRELDETDIKVLNLLAQGYSRNEIEEMMGYSHEYINQKLSTVIYPKLGAINIAQAIYIATKRGIIT